MKNMFTKPRILLIEDNEGDILLTTEALTEHEVSNDISVVKDGWEAIQYLERRGIYENIVLPDLIILDINLPKLNGYEVLKSIRGNNEIQHIPVVILSTSHNEHNILHLYDNFANCYITKPVEVNEFMNVVLSIQDFWASIAK